MSNDYDLNDIAENYSRKSDADLIHIATSNARIRPMNYIFDYPIIRL